MSRRGVGHWVRMIGQARRPRAPLAVVLGLSAILVLLVPSAAAAGPNWVPPVNAPLWGGFKEPAYHHGVDLGAKRYVPIRAASAGVVIVSKCNASLDGEPYSCDIDGSPQVQGCGWYIDIAHEDGVVTRYCHMVEAPLVTVGDRVETGQRVGYVGSSGNSSAPHLHFEVHLVPKGERAHNGNAIDPVPFMAKRGAKLGVGNDKPEPPEGPAPSPEPEPAPAPSVAIDGRADVDGDGLTDLVVWRPETGEWHIRLAAGTEPEPVALGIEGDIPVVADYDGDGRDDLAVWRPTDGRWLVQTSSGAPVSDVVLGASGDMPVPGDFDGDGFADFAVWRPYDASWLVRYSSGTAEAEATEPQPIALGEAGDLPVVADYDGDHRDDLAVWRPLTGEWIIQPSSGGDPATGVVLGADGDIPVPGDYDGDGKADLSVWKPSVGVWTIIYSGGAAAEPIPLGAAGDEPVVGDYDGDGKHDVALWRRSDGQWLILPSSGERLVAGEPGTGIIFGVEGDRPANRPQWLDENGQLPVLGEILLRERFGGGPLRPGTAG